MSKIITVNIEELENALNDPETSDHHDVLAALCAVFNGIYREITDRRNVSQNIKVEFAPGKITVSRYASHEVYRASDTFYWYEREQINGINWTTTFHYCDLFGWRLGYNIPIGELYVGLVNKIENLDVVCKEMAGTKVEITP